MRARVNDPGCRSPGWYTWEEPMAHGTFLFDAARRVGRGQFARFL